MSLFQSILGGKAQPSDGGLFSAANPFRSAPGAAEYISKAVAAPAAAAAKPPVEGASEVPPAADVKIKKRSKAKRQEEEALQDTPPAVEQQQLTKPNTSAKQKPKKRKASATAEAAEVVEQPPTAKKAKKSSKTQRAADDEEPAAQQEPVRKRAKKRAKADASSGAEKSIERSLGRIKAAAKAAKAAEARQREESSDSGDEDEVLGDLSDSDEEPPEADATAQPQGKLTPEEEAEQLDRTIFVGNLPTSLTRKSLKAIFSQFGAVQSVRLRSVPIRLDKKLPRRAAILAGRVSGDRGTAHAYVVFKEAAAATAALELNMKEVEGLHIRVDKASRPSKDGSSSGVEYDRARSVFVGNLAFDIEDEDVIRFFNDAAGGEDSVAAVRVVRDAETNLGKGFAFVLFSTTQGARMAVARDGAELRGRPIRVSRVSSKKRSQPPKSAAAQTASGPQGTGAARRLAAKAERSTSWQGLRTKGKDKLVSGAASRLPGPQKSTGARKGGRPGSGGGPQRKGRNPGSPGRGRGRGRGRR